MNIRSFAGVALSAAVAFGVMLSGPSAFAETLQGAGKAVSGDQIEVAGRRVFVNGVVAPKGTGAQFALESLLKKGAVKCTLEPVSQGSVPTADCVLGKENISVSLVSIGAAVPYLENDTDLRSHRLQTHPEITGLDDGLTPPRDCVIKGNVSSRGKTYRLYHMPGDPNYLRTKIDVTKGEAWFCSEADAEAAGFRRAGS